MFVSPLQTQYTAFSSHSPMPSLQFGNKKPLTTRDQRPQTSAKPSRMKPAVKRVRQTAEPKRIIQNAAPEGFFEGTDGATLKKMWRAGLSAGKIIMGEYRKAHKLTFKSPNEMRGIVTEVDLKAQKAIQRMMKGIPFIGEETWKPEQQKLLRSEDGVIVTDSVDGTGNYVNRLRDFATSIGFVRQGIPILGFIKDYSDGAVYMARKGLGAWRVTRNGKQWERLQVSNNPHFELALVGTSYPSNKDARTCHAMNIAKIMANCQGVRSSGSGALDLLRVAGLGLDGFVDMSTNIWDVIAALLIAKEAGAKVTDFSNRQRERFTKQRLSLVVSNGQPEIHNGLRRELPSQANVDRNYLDVYNGLPKKPLKTRPPKSVKNVKA